MHVRFALLTAGLLAMSAVMGSSAARAEDRGVVIVQRDYAAAAAPAPAPDANDLVGRLRQAGVETTLGINLSSADMPLPLMQLQRPDPAPGARIVILSGRFVSGAGDSWLLGVDAARPGLAMVDRQALSVGRVMALMRDGGRDGVLLLGDASAGASAGPRLRAGLGRLRTGAGLTIVTGPPAAIGRAATLMLAPGGSITAALRADPSLRLIGAAGSQAPPPKAAAPASPATGSPDAPLALTVPALPGEAEAWVRAAAQNRTAVYLDFLSRFPAGRYAAVARQRLGDAAPPVDSPNPASPQQAGDDSASAAVAEITLNLSLGERSGLQRALTELGYDTNGTDGTFGTATRQALQRWQTAAGLPPTGFLNAGSVDRLRRDAARAALRR